MPDVNTGSIADFVITGIIPFPTAISGILTTIVDNQRFFVEQFTGETIGSVIGEQFQPAITHLSTANVLQLMAVQDFGVKSVTVGDTTTDNANLMAMSQQFRDIGIGQLQSLTKGVSVFKARG